MTNAVLTPGAPQVFSYRPPAGPASAIKPKDLNPKDIVDLTIAVDRSLPDARLVPGTSLRINVIAKDKKGKTYSTAEGTLATKNLRIVPTLMSYDAATATVTAEADRARVGDGLYAVRADYGQPNKNPKSKTIALRPDFAAVLGPDPDQVQSLKAEVVGVTGPGLLQPGRTVSVRVIATDREGREYATEGRSLPLPVSRLEFAGQMVEWQPGTAQFTPSSDRTALQGKKFVARVSYRGRTDVAVEHEFEADFAAVDGPEPSDVRSLDISVAGASTGGKLIPGTKAQFNVSVTDKGGRRYDLHGGTFKLPPSRLKIAPENLTADPATGLLEANSESKKMLNKQYTLAVAYEGRDELSKAVSYEPDFEGLLQSFMFKGDEIVVAGDPGSAGESGPEGDHGRSGTSSSQKYGQGGDAAPGAAGRDGRPGRRGGRGPNVKIVATEATTLDGGTRLVAFEITVPGQEPRYYLRPLDSKPIRIVTRGGRGGPGGSGGSGGSGGQGGAGHSTGSGGEGGMGGNGGPGGQGGPGGNIVLIVGSQELAASFEPLSTGGIGGQGGQSGNGGSGGRAGSAVAAAIVGMLSALSGETVPTPILGTSGSRGESGMNGDPGAEGEPGQQQVQTGGEALALPRKIGAIPALASVIVFPETSEKRP